MSCVMNMNFVKIVSVAVILNKGEVNSIFTSGTFERFWIKFDIDLYAVTPSHYSFHENR